MALGKVDKMSEIDEHIMKRFDIQKRLGKGAYGIVWKAVDRKTKGVVAVKKIFDAFRNQTDAQRTFREIMFLQSFKSHANIVKLHSIHKASNNRDIYLAFEYMETDLHNVIKKNNVLKDIHKRYIMYQLFKAINYIHSGNVIHRDLKPSNVLIDSMCRCKIADFGLARSVQENPEGSLGDGDPTLTDYVATRWYRAPEILIANRKYTKGIDLWSLGCILAEMLAGKPIFPGSSTVNQVEKIMATIPTPSHEDISLVCPSGVGSSMIKNASSVQKIPLKTILGSNISDDAISLLNKLLVFNPLKRLKASEALNDLYVKKFHESDHNLTMPKVVVVPLSDNIRLSVDEYRNKLYELMQHKTRVYGMESRLKPPRNTNKERSTNFSYSEPKISQKVTSGTLTHKSEPKISRNVSQVLPERHYKGGGDWKSHSKSNSELNKKKTVKAHHGHNDYYNSFNSFNKNHGIITASALMELRATGFK